MRIEYVVTSKPGMTPFATRDTLAEAEAEALLARRLGLEGEIITYAGGIAQPTE